MRRRGGHHHPPAPLHPPSFSAAGHAGKGRASRRHFPAAARCLLGAVVPAREQRPRPERPPPPLTAVPLPSALRAASPGPAGQSGRKPSARAPQPPGKPEGRGRAPPAGPLRPSCSVPLVAPSRTLVPKGARVWRCGALEGGTRVTRQWLPLGGSPRHLAVLHMRADTQPLSWPWTRLWLCRWRGHGMGKGRSG